MIVDFRQGIITYPTSNNQQVFLAKVGQYVSLRTTNGRTDITFAHKTEDYLFTESHDVENAWGPFASSTSYWLYWEINLLTAERTFGYTTLEPVYGLTAPQTPANGQHWFDTSVNCMKVYQNTIWREVVRVFACKLFDSTFTSMTGNSGFAGTQVGISAVGTVAGRIIVDNTGTPIRRSTGMFFTTEDDFFVNGSPINVIRLEANIINATAQENIARYQVVKFTSFGAIHLATYDDTETTMIAMSMEDLLVNKTGTLCVQGVITNPLWNFTTVGAKLWIDSTSGLLTEIDPHLTDPINHQIGKVPVARVLTPTSIFFDQGLGSKGDKGDVGQASPPATDMVLGIVKLATPAANASNPIVVGDNDPRLAPYIHPTSHPATMVTTSPYKTLTGDNVQLMLQQLEDKTYTLSGLTDVTLTSPTNTQVLSFNGTNWVNSSIQTGGASYFNDLLDVTLTNVKYGQGITFDGVNWKNTTLYPNNTRWCTGENNVGQFGDSTTTSSTSLISVETFIGSLEGVIGGSAANLLRVRSNGTLWASGDNTIGALGDGTIVSQSSPVQIGSLTNWKSVAKIQGGNHNIATKTDGTLWGWGWNGYYQLGIGDTTNRSSPVQIGSLTNWKQASGGYIHSAAIKTDGTLWAWGTNSFFGLNYGQLGVGDNLNRSSPVQVGSLTDWKQVSCGMVSTVAIKNDGTLWTWGNNTYGQLGLGDTSDRSSPVQVGSLTDWKYAESAQYGVAAIKIDGTLWTWGADINGVLGLGNSETTSVSSPTQVGSFTDWNTVSCGYNHMIGIRDNGTAWGWGNGQTGEFGVGEATYSVPTQIGVSNNWIGASTNHKTTHLISESDLVYDLATSGVGGGSGGGATIVNDISTNAIRYPTFVDAVAGSMSTAYVASTKLQYNPSNGMLYSTYFNTTSDAKLKTNVALIVDALNKVEQIDGVGYNWVDTGEWSYGVIAQQVEQIIPEAVAINNEGIKTVNYQMLIPFLIESIKQLTERVKTLENK